MSEDWKVACIVPVYRGRGDRTESARYRGTIILSIHGKVYGGGGPN